MSHERQLQKRKQTFLAVQFMRMVNESSALSVFDDIDFDEDANEIGFTPAGSVHVAIEQSMHICQLFYLTLYPYIEGGKIKYSLLGN